MKSFELLRILNPKREPSTKGEADIFPYYAGYSPSFASSLLASLEAEEGSVVLDPWNGAGTSTTAAVARGLNATGCDLNPVMLVVAKADLMSPLEVPSLSPLVKEILSQAQLVRGETSYEPLQRWFAPSAASTIRSIERTIYKLLVDEAASEMPFSSRGAQRSLSPIAAMLYVGLFRATRNLARSFISSNPTWIKSPPTPAHRVRPSFEHIRTAFEIEMVALSAKASQRDTPREAAVADIVWADSTELPFASGSFDVVLTSPPYCTRIDYAVATAFELAVLGIGDESLQKLRQQMLGTSTVPKQIRTGESLSPTCDDFIQKLTAHASKASSGYYLKSHIQYFESLKKSISELSRVCQSGGRCIVIVQDSYYKEIHNDLPRIVSEFAEPNGFVLRREDRFTTTRSMVNVNTRSRKYLAERATTESVLCFERT